MAVTQHAALGLVFALKLQPKQLTLRVPLDTCLGQGGPKLEQPRMIRASPASLTLGRRPNPRAILGAAPSPAVPGVKREKDSTGPWTCRSDFSERERFREGGSGRLC